MSAPLIERIESRIIEIQVELADLQQEVEEKESMIEELQRLLGDEGEAEDDEGKDRKPVKPQRPARPRKPKAAQADSQPPTNGQAPKGGNRWREPIREFLLKGPQRFGMIREHLGVSDPTLSGALKDPWFEKMDPEAGSSPWQLTEAGRLALGN